MSTHDRGEHGALSAVDYDPFDAGALTRVVPSTEPQREIWLAAKLSAEASLAYNESAGLRLHGTLDRGALHAALQDLVGRHDALRATFGPDGETFCVLDGLSLAMPETDLAPLAPAGRAAALDARLRHAVETPFDLEHGPLFRAELVACAGDDHVLILTAHHIVCDGWSWWVIVRELAALYAERTGVAPAPLPAADSFADFALLQARGSEQHAHIEDEAYWRSCYADSIPVLDLPADHPRPALRTFASGRVDHVFEVALMSAIRSAGAQHGASVFATLLGSFAATLARIAGHAEVVIGIPAAAQAIDGHDHLVGHGVNLLPLRFAPDPAAPFTQLLGAAAATLLDGLEHQQCTFGSLLKKLGVERDASRLPLVSVLFNIDQALDHESATFPGLALTFAGTARSFENFELSINAVQEHGQLRLECQYNRDLFDADTVRRWLRAYETLLRAAVAQPQLALGELPLVDAAGRAELQALQPPATPFDIEQRAHEAFEAQCDRAPTRIAVRAGATALTYAELEARANRIAHCLRARGVHRGALVGIALDRDADMLAALLGVLKSGAGYVPLDPAFPTERLTYMVGDAGLAALLTHSAHADRFDLRGRPVLELDRLEAELAALPAARLGRDAEAATPDAVAYVIYTSGSTGQPKGVLVPHRATANFLAAMQRAPGLAAEDRLVAVTTLSFDIAFMELLLPLCVGAQVILASRDEVRDGVALRALVEASAATVLQATPSGWRLLLESGWQGHPGFKAISGGEPLSLNLAEALLARCGEVWNGYGPTEATVYATFWKVQNPRDGIVIGRPVANTSVWIRDEQGQLCPPGVPGELWIGGCSVALGYLDRPQLTAERFVVDPYAGQADARLYRTGDRGRWLANGNIEHLGRVDFQIKLRGYRIEPGEIEAHLLSRPEIARALVIVREDRAGDARLVAYLVAASAAAVDEASLRGALRELLPDYMIPQHFMLLDAIPLLPNGKLDRGRLPPPLDTGAGPVARVAARDELEQQVATAMADVLGSAGLGVHDNFFERGGHSLLAARLVARLNRELELGLPLRSVFDAPTVALMAAAIRAVQTDGAPSHGMPRSIPRLADRTVAPVSLNQQRMWYLEQIHPGRVVYNAPSAHRLRGAMNEAAFEQALRELVRRQPTLRTSIEPGDKTAIQRIHAELAFELPLEDLSGLPDDERETTLARRLDELTAEPFDLARPPLFRARLFRLGAEEHVFYFAVHHIIWDGWSFDLLYEEMSSLYGAFCAGRPTPLAPLSVEYGDFAAWHGQWMRGEELERQLDHWRQHLAGKLEPLELPLDRPRPPRMTGAGATEWIHLPAAQQTALHQLGQQAQSTLFMVLLGAWYVLLQRLSGQHDLIVTTQVRGRDTAELERVMGYFANALPLRAQLDPGMSFIEVVRKMRSVVLDAFAYPDVPFDHLITELDVRRDDSRPPISQAMFSFQDVRLRPDHWGDLAHQNIPLFQHGAADDVGLWFIEHGHGLAGGLTYDTDIFDASSAARWAGYLKQILAQAVAKPDTTLGEFELMDAAERQQLLQGWNATAMDYDRSQGLPTLIEAQMARTPQRIAAECGGERIDYAGLDRASRSLAAALGRRDLGRGDRIGVCVPRSLSMLVAVLGVLRSGAAYVPLDPTFPPERLQYMAEHSRLRHVLVTDAGLLPSAVAQGRELLGVDALAAEPAGPAGLPEVRGDDTAYVLYTSGSTGKPKGVGILHRNLVNFLLSMAREPGFTENDTLCAATTLSFDIAGLELYLPLIVGGRMVIATDEEQHEPHQMWELIDRSGCNVLQTTPSMLRLLQDTGQDRAVHQLSLFVGGEALPLVVANSMAGRCREFWNLYGPTETTIWSTVARIKPGINVVPLGRPIANTQVYVLDARLRPLPPGVIGEIWIAGDGVAAGYLFQPELTAERFVDDPFAGGAARMYRTGDLGTWRDGVLYFHGRADHQIKVRGFRIEPGDIEAVADSYPVVRESVVVLRQFGANDARMVLYVAIDGDIETTARALREHLRQRLPGYMLPQHIEALVELPKTPNGKIDRKALPMPAAAVAVAESRSAPTEPTATAETMTDPRELYLANIWRELIGVQDIRRSDNFLDLGGHSMLAVEFATRVRKETAVSLRLLNIVTGTLASLAVELPRDRSVSTSEDSLWSRLRKRLGRR
ncbi:hypothetical protein B0E47_11665 [Rhodanobacter sp. B05]|uniref:non-ribosomal peptide synthetase n=1 Tax=Rhodanobacter sp. B05 TaxID=1945859 RepID=UPI00098592D0|nr:non-ribosomal peptide synthetase [Rhodanobacter sp. B05]OOG53856.1 hypothetical protein B0E47_11665 [Rhodanobacter sp. B05]